MLSEKLGQISPEASKDGQKVSNQKFQIKLNFHQKNKSNWFANAWETWIVQGINILYIQLTALLVEILPRTNRDVMRERTKDLNNILLRITTMTDQLKSHIPAIVK